jgi:hypothetical protein
VEDIEEDIEDIKHRLVSIYPRGITKNIQQDDKKIVLLKNKKRKKI